MAKEKARNITTAAIATTFLLGMLVAPILLAQPSQVKGGVGRAEII
jgi:hypothetical protein